MASIAALNDLRHDELLSLIMSNLSLRLPMTLRPEKCAFFRKVFFGIALISCPGKNIWSNANNEFYILCSSPCKPAPKKPLLWQQVMFSPALLWKEPSHLLNAAAGGKNVGANGFFATYPSINDHTFQSPPQSCASELGVWSKFVIKISFASIFNHWMVD